MISRRYVLHFPPNLANRPMVSKLASEFKLEFNILRSAIEPNNEGVMYLEITGKADAIKKGVLFLEEVGLTVKQLDQQIHRIDDRCIDCGACVGFCPTKCFTLDAISSNVNFDNKHCTACGFCIRACPRFAMEVRL